jgi:lipid-A-disaccharide synthase
VILVDYAGFNMRIARFAKKQGMQVFYYISPKVWAWNQNRAYKIKATVDKLFVIFPFEQDFFQKYDYKVDYVGNPLLDAIAGFKPNPAFRETNKLKERPIIALLPGSRKQEVEKMLEVMLGISPYFPEYEFVIAAVSNIPQAWYAKYTRVPHVSVVYDQTYDLLAHAEVAIVTSGTATLETALFEVPQVVCYKTGFISYTIAKELIKVKYISLVNLIADKEVVRELIQNDLTSTNISYELKKILPGTAGRKAQLKAYKDIKKLLGAPGASARTAKLMVKYLKEEKVS